MKRLFEEHSVVEVKGGNQDIDLILGEIINTFKKHHCTILNHNDMSFEFKTFPFLKWSHSPFLGITSGKVELKSKNNKVLVTYHVHRKELFWLSFIIAGGFAVFLYTNMLIASTQELMAYIFGVPVLFFFSYALYFGVNGTIFNQVLIKTANKALKQGREKASRPLA